MEGIVQIHTIEFSGEPIHPNLNQIWDCLAQIPFESASNLMINFQLLLSVTTLAIVTGSNVSAQGSESALSLYLRREDPIALANLHARAEQNDKAAAYWLGEMYFKGEGVLQDHERAISFFHIAAEQGYGFAQEKLGFIYSSGTRVPQDYVEAAYWFRLSAEQGFAISQWQLGLNYEKGRGVPQDYLEAIRLYLQSLENGVTVALGDLGLIYADGLGVEQNYVIAHMWLNLATAAGWEEMRLSRNALESRMTPAQITEAQSLARECLAQNYKNCGR